jgi:stage III sporulation protein AA
MINGIVLGVSELEGIFKRICGGSLYAHAETIKRGYITLDGGIRIGIAGSATCEGGRIIGVGEIGSLCIRLPRHIFVDASILCELIASGEGMLIYARAGVGKTTLLRAIASELSDASGSYGLSVSVIDTRGELCVGLDGESKQIDLMDAYPKGVGMEIAVRVLSPDVIICDEIGNSEVSEIRSAVNFGTRVVASAHADSARELFLRVGMRELHLSGAFGYYVGISRKVGAVGFDYDILKRKDADAFFEDCR